MLSLLSFFPHLLLSVVLLPFAQATAQCGCGNVPMESVDHCFKHEDFKGYCASFVTGAPYFFIENKNAKVSTPRKIMLPDSVTPVHSWLQNLAAEKKLKLSTADILFIEAANKNRMTLESLENWDQEQLAKGWTLEPSGLAWKMIEKGSGKIPQTGKKVNVHYTGWLLDGKKFDSSLDRKQSFGFTLGMKQVIQGWDEGVALFPAGSNFLLRIPPELGYGARGYPPVIPPNSVLIFQIQILSAE